MARRMAEDRAAQVLDADGPTAPPRRNGELVFETPWESRLFGLTLSLYRAGLFEWEEFRQLLIAEIQAWEQQHTETEPWSYYTCWQRSFERLLVTKGVCKAAELDARTAAFAERPAGHDH